MNRPSGPNLARYRWLLILVALSASCSRAEPQAATLRLVDHFHSAVVDGTRAAPMPPAHVWRFDNLSEETGSEGSQAIPAWRAGPGIADLAVTDGNLTGRATSDTPTVHLTRSLPADDGDLLHSVEVRLRVSEGTNLAVTLPDPQQVDRQGISPALQQPWPLQAPLLPGERPQTYVMRVADSSLRTSVPSFAIRDVLVRPTDASGAEFAIESVRLVFRKEYLATIPSGIGWQGLSEIYRETLVTRSPERVRMTLRLPDRPWLDMSVGTIEQEPVRFRVAVGRADGAADGSSEELLDRTVSVPHRWEDASADLSEYAGESVTVTLSIDAETNGALGFWGAPVIRNRADLPSGGAAAARSAATDPPQGVILIIADTLRRDHLEAYGYQRETSPAIGRMAAGGALFEDCIAQATWTKVSVPSILTSLYPTSHRIVEMTDGLSPVAATVAEVFRDAGYATLGTASIPYTGRLTNLHQGFEEFYERDSLRLPVDLSPTRTARAYVDRVLPWLDAHRDVPFFVLLHVADPHSPFEPYPPYDTMWTDRATLAEHRRQKRRVRAFIGDPDRRRFEVPNREELESAGVDPDEYIAREIAGYDGAIRAMDYEIGRVLQHLRELGLEERTLVAFTSDHGEEFLEHGSQFHGRTVYGEITNVPLILHWPGRVPAGRVVAETVQTIDVMPTLLELSGLPLPEGIQGRSLVPMLAARAGASTPSWQSRPAITELYRPGELDSLAIVLDGWKLIRNRQSLPGRPAYELYDHRADPLDLRDVADRHPDVVARLAAELSDWETLAIAAQLPTEDEAIRALDAETLRRLRSLGYIR